MTEPSASSPLGSVDKALRALDLLAQAGASGVTLLQLANELQLNKSSVHRTLAALKYRGYVTQNPDTSYRLGPAALTLSTAMTSEDNLPALVRPVLEAICTQFQELVHVGMLVGADIVYLDKVEPQRPIRVWSAVGRRQPAATTALGRALLAATPYTEASLARYATATVSPATLAQHLDTAKAAGYAIESEETESGIGCAAVALGLGQTPLVAISVTTMVELTGALRLRSIGQRLHGVLSAAAPAPLRIMNGSHDSQKTAHL